MKPLLSSEYPEKQTLYNLTEEIQLWCTARPTNANSSALCSLNVCPPMSSKTQIHFTQNDQAIWLCHTTATQNHFPKIIIIKQLSGRCLMAPLIVADITQLTFVRNASNAYPLYFLSCFPFEYYLFLSEQSAEPPVNSSANARKTFTETKRQYLRIRCTVRNHGRLRAQKVTRELERGGQDQESPVAQIANSSSWGKPW